MQCQRPTSVRHLRFIKISHILLHYSPSAYIEISSALLCRSCYWMMRWHLVLISRPQYIINVQHWVLYILYLLSRLLAFTSVGGKNWIILIITQTLSHIASSYLWYWYWWCHLLKHWLSLIRLWHCCSLCVPMVTMCGVYFPPTKAAMSIKPLVSISFRSRRFFMHTSKTHLLVWLILIKWQSNLSRCMLWVLVITA